MAVAVWLIVLLFVVNAVFGSLLVLGVFKFMEHQYGIAAVGGILLGTGAIYAEATVGERYFSVTLEEMKLLVLAASLGAVLGVVGTVFVVEPEI